MMMPEHSCQAGGTDGAAALRVSIQIAVVERGRVGDGRIAGRGGNRVVLANVMEPAPATTQRRLPFAENVPGEAETRPQGDPGSLVQAFGKTVLAADEGAVGRVSGTGHILADERRLGQRVGDRVARHTAAAGIK